MSTESLAPNVLSLEEVAARVRRVQELVGEDGKEFAAKVGVPYGTMRAYVSALRAPSPEFLFGLFHAYGINSTWVLTGCGPIKFDDPSLGGFDHARDTVVVPVLSVHASAGNGTVNEPVAEYKVGGMAVAVEWLRKRQLNAANLAVIKVRGTSMEPVLQHGDQLLLDKSDRTPRSGFVYVLRQGDELLVKFCQLLPSGVLRVSSANANFPAYDVELGRGEDVEIVGRVVASMHDWE